MYVEIATRAEPVQWKQILCQVAPDLGHLASRLFDNNTLSIHFQICLTVKTRTLLLPSPPQQHGNQCRRDTWLRVPTAHSGWLQTLRLVLRLEYISRCIAEVPPYLIPSQWMHCA